LIAIADVQTFKLSQDQSDLSLSNSFKTTADLGSASHFCFDWSQRVIKQV